MSGVLNTVNAMLGSVSLTASHTSSDILNVNLSITNVSGRCYSLENTQNYTILPNITTLTTNYGYLNSCCINLSTICNDLNTSLSNASALLKTLNSSFISASAELDNLLSSNVNINSSITTINGFLSLVNSSLTALFLSKD